MKSKVGSFFIVLFALVLVFLFTWISFDGAANTAAVIAAKDRVVKLNATITSSDMYTETDEGYEREYWNAKVSYTYNGVLYEGVFYKRFNSQPQIGKEVAVKIDPYEPQKLLPSNGELGLSVVLSPVFLSGVSIALYYLIYSGVESILAKGGKLSKKAKTIPLTGVGLILLAESVIFYNTNSSFVYLVFALIAFSVTLYVVYREGKKQENSTPAEADAA